MPNIPNAALKIGAESLNQHPVCYSKVRVSGSIKMPYFMHSRSGCMPGQIQKFTTNEVSKVNYNLPIKRNIINDSFRRKNFLGSNSPIGLKFQTNSIHQFTYQKYVPYDDLTLEVAIKEAYRQVYGNFFAMESERPIESERRLRNGDISIREFIRDLAKSPFYKKHYFENVTQQRFIELSFKHILGRPPMNHSEVAKHIGIVNHHGFDYHIDQLIDSIEYEEAFGNDTIPFLKCWTSSNGIRTKSFLDSIKLKDSFASSDNSLHKRITRPESQSGKSLLLS